MNKIDLHEEFLTALCSRVPRRPDLINRISDILLIEKESASRRLSGKVNFSVREMGALASTLGITIDSLLHKDTDFQWFPVTLEAPMKRRRSMEYLYNAIQSSIDRIKQITESPAEAGKVCSTLPSELYILYPTLARFMLFKWGYYFVGTEEFYNFSQWEAPAEFSLIKDRIMEGFQFEKVFHIWDNALIWTLAGEIENFHRMRIISTEERDTIRDELHLLLTDAENTLNGNAPLIQYPNAKFSFYVSTMNLGFTSSYYSSDKACIAMFKTNFSSAILEDCQEVAKLKEWVRSLRNVSVLLSGSGHIERRLYFERQHEILRYVLQ